MFNFLKLSNPKYVILDMKDDISVWELAQIFQASKAMDDIKNLEKLPESCKRHFKIEE